MHTGKSIRYSTGSAGELANGHNFSVGTDKLSRRFRWNRRVNTYKRHRCPPDIISYAVWPYCRFNLSTRNIEDLLGERGIAVTREAIRLWCIKFGTIYTRRLKRKHRGYGDTFFIDEVFAGVPDHSINGKQHDLWRAVDQDGEIVDVYLPSKRDGAAVKNLFNPGRHLVSAHHYRELRISAVREWSRAVG